MSEQNNIDLSGFFKFVINHKALFWTFIVLTTLIVSVCLGVSYSYEKRAIKLHQALKDNGVMTHAVSYREICNSKIPVRHYQFTVNNTTYRKSLMPETASTCIDPLGDTVKIYYVKDNPHLNLTESQLQAGVSSKLYYALTAMFFAMLFWFYAFYKIAISHYVLIQLNEHNPLPDRYLNKE